MLGGPPESISETLDTLSRPNKSIRSTYLSGPFRGVFKDDAAPLSRYSVEDFLTDPDHPKLKEAVATVCSQVGTAPNYRHSMERAGLAAETNRQIKDGVRSGRPTSSTVLRLLALDPQMSLLKGGRKWPCNFQGHHWWSVGGTWRCWGLESVWHVAVSSV